MTHVRQKPSISNYLHTRDGVRILISYVISKLFLHITVVERSILRILDQSFFSVRNMSCISRLTDRILHCVTYYPLFDLTNSINRPRFNIP